MKRSIAVILVAVTAILLIVLILVWRGRPQGGRPGGPESRAVTGLVWPTTRLTSVPATLPSDWRGISRDEAIIPRGGIVTRWDSDCDGQYDVNEIITYGTLRFNEQTWTDHKTIKWRVFAVAGPGRESAQGVRPSGWDGRGDSGRRESDRSAYGHDGEPRREPGTALRSSFVSPRNTDRRAI